MSDYSQLRKNTVNSKNQLADTDIVRFINPNGKGRRILFVGNSMTLHGICHEIGWKYECGMAASSKENDYVHIMIDEISETCDDCAFCICQVADWERRVFDGTFQFGSIQNAQDFCADIIIFRAIENCPWKNFENEMFVDELNRLFLFLSPENKTEIIMTTGFWKHPGNSAIIDYSERCGLPLVDLEDLGELDEMKAIGLFEHEGVANHPGDLGMKHMADRIMKEAKRFLF